MVNLEDILDYKKIYVDKTRYVAQILRKKGAFQLLIRPRRFGKTLFLNTIRDVLLGHRHLFQNTYIGQNHDWTTKYTVIRLEFVQGQSVDCFSVTFELIADEYEVKFAPDSRINKTDALYFSHIITGMYTSKGIRNIALLVDEYDLPLLAGSDSLEYYVKFLRSLKALLQNGYLKYVIMTGCTSINNLKVDTGDKTSPVRLSRELNVEDISLQPEYNGVCGYTKSEIQKYYGHHINEISTRHKRTEEEVFTEIQCWYDYYMFSGSTTEPTIYNPVSIMQYLELKRFEGQSFWAVKRDHPRLAVKTLLEEAVAAGDNLLNLEKRFTYDELYEDTPGTSYLYRESFEALLFQTGLLTIASHVPSTNKYSLKIPNREVQTEFHQIIVEVMMSSRSCVNYGKQIAKNLNDLKFPELVEVYNNFIRKKYLMRAWTSAKDKEGKSQLMFRNALMLADKFPVILLEKETIKRDNGETGFIDVYLESYQKYKAMIDCKYDDTNMDACMEQVENYDLPSVKDTIDIDTNLPIIRMCINFVEGKIERIVARKYDAKDRFIEEIKEYVVRKDDDSFPYKCTWPGCKASFKEPESLPKHKGWHTREENRRKSHMPKR